MKYLPYRTHITGEPGTMTGSVTDLTKPASDRSRVPSGAVPQVALGASVRAATEKRVAFAVQGGTEEDGGGVPTLAVPKRKAVAGVGSFKSHQFSLWSIFDVLSMGKARGLAVRLEARTGGKAKVKTQYLQDYNLLESTFLTSSIIILLCGIMFKAAGFDAGYVRLCVCMCVLLRVRCCCCCCGAQVYMLPALSPPAFSLHRSIQEALLEWFVLVMCIGSAVVCVLAITMELSASFAYYGRAFKLRYQSHRKPRLRAVAEARGTLWSRVMRVLVRVCVCVL